jgi:hypothetical protein
MRTKPTITTLAATAAALIVIGSDTIRSDEGASGSGIDAAEIGHAKCEAERRLGALAKHRLNSCSAPARSTEERAP